MKLTPELIYEAAIDDDVFAELPVAIAAAMGARSCVLHWRDEVGAAEVFAHSGHFSDVHMANYAANFASHDLWTDAGMRTGYVNKAWNTSDLVPAKEYEHSVFYNEWIRTMGDDTFYCCGSVMQTAHGSGIIGLHRGRGQADFGERALHDLNRQVGHLRRMFAIRGRLDQFTKRNNLLESIFASGRQPAFLLSATKRADLINPAGEALLARGRYLTARGGRIVPASRDCEAAFDQAVAAASSATERRGASCLLRSIDGAVAIASVTPVMTQQSAPAILVTIDEPRERLPTEVVSAHLRDAYGLSPAETDIALRLTDGTGLRDISDQRGSTIETVRFQVKSILSKIDVGRQSDVVRIIAQLR